MYVNIVYNNNVNVEFGPFDTIAQADAFIANKRKEKNVIDAYIMEQK